MITALLTAIPTILGFLSSALPNFVKYLEKGREYDHEVKLLEIKMEAARRNLDIERLTASAKAAVEEGTSLRHHDLALNDSKFINILRASVRPVLTYFFFFTFIGIKVAAVYVMINKDVPMAEMLPVIWDSYSMGIFGAICGFWFGTRTMMHLENLRK